MLVTNDCQTMKFFIEIKNKKINQNVQRNIFAITLNFLRWILVFIIFYFDDDIVHKIRICLSFSRWRSFARLFLSFSIFIPKSKIHTDDRHVFK